MTDAFEYEVDASAVEKALRTLGGKRTARILRSSLNRVGFEHTRWMQTRRFVPYRGHSPQRGVQTRTGALRRSVGHAVRGDKLSDLTLRMFVASDYARIQEFGGDVRPKRSQFLTIPTRAALTRSGAQSGRFRIRKAGSGYTTDAGPTFIFQGRSGGLFIGIRRADGEPIKARGGSPKAFYTLKRSVHIPPRLGFRAEYRGHTSRFLRRELQGAGEEMVRLAVAK